MISPFRHIAGYTGTRCVWRQGVRALCLAGAAAMALQTAGAAEPGAGSAVKLSAERAESRAELKSLSDKITLSRGKVARLQADIAKLADDEASLREARVEAATRQKALQRKLADDEKRLADLHRRENAIHENLMARRDVLAEVLGALERIGRNPPPALLVTPDDALASVRSAILLGAVVPKMREQARALADQLNDLAQVQTAMADERDRMKATLGDVAEEKKRLALLMARKTMLRARNETDLAEQRAHADDLAKQAGDVKDLIVSLETRIASVREAARQARLEEDRRRRRTREQIEAARRRAQDGVPDKNRIAPAFAFSDLKDKLDLPVAGDPVRWFGDDDGTGHPLQGMMVSAQPDAIITAPADAWVVYAGPFRRYGDLLILNAGDGYHLVMAGMSRIEVAQGQFVIAGEPVAQMGQTRLAGATALALVSSQPTLYIEFRKDGKPVDPAPWWSGNLSGRVSNGT